MEVKISLAMIVKNEEKYIERCISSVNNLVDEIVIVDTGSTDNTIDIIKKFPNIKLFHAKWNDNFSEVRNYSINQSTGNYVLVLDADEYIISGTRSDLELAMSNNSIGRILIESRFIKDNQEHSSKTYVSRFFPKDIRYTGSIHEQLDSNLQRIKLNILVKHDGYYKTNKSDRNIPLLIGELKKNPKDPYYFFQLGKELRIKENFKEAFHFLKKAYELTNTKFPYYEEMVIEMINCGKEYGENEVFEIIAQNEGKLEKVSDFHFAKGMFYLNYSIQNPNKAKKFITQIESCFLNCLSLNDVGYEYVQGTSSYLAAYNLGVFYEVTGNMKKALDYYIISSSSGYSLAKERVSKFPH